MTTMTTTTITRKLRQCAKGYPKSIHATVCRAAADRIEMAAKRISALATMDDPEEMCSCISAVEEILNGRVPAESELPLKGAR